MDPHPPPPVAGRDPLLRFLVVAAALYIGWYLLYSLVIHPWGKLDRAVIDNLMWVSGGLLTLLGFTLLPEPGIDNNRYIGIEGGHHLWIGDPCNGVSLFAVFLIFLIAYAGPWRHKLWFGALGLLVIHLINAIRVAALAIIVSYDYELLNFNHDYTFYVVVYGCVFLLWFWWVKRFSVNRAEVVA
jgi:exosortase family protein XrtF